MNVHVRTWAIYEYELVNYQGENINMNVVNDYMIVMFDYKRVNNEFLIIDYNILAYN